MVTASLPKGGDRTSYPGLFLDLDHTLFDPAALPPFALEPVADELRRVNEEASAISRGALEASIDKLVDEPADVVARRHQWPEVLYRACLAAADAVLLPDSIDPYPDVEEVVKLPHLKILVTTGIPGIQQRKVRALGFESWLHAMYVDDVAAQTRRGKKALFELALATESLSPDKTLVVGDRLDSEIAAGLALGLRTVHVARAGCSGHCIADDCMADLRGLREIV